VYGLPKGLDWTFLVGAALEQVCIGQHTIHFRFDRNISISVYSSLRLDDAKSPSGDFGEMATVLCELIGQGITAAGPLDARTLAIRFGSRRLELFDDSDQFESFVIAVGGDVFVV